MIVYGVLIENQNDATLAPLSFFLFKIIGVNRGKNTVDGGKISKISQSQQMKCQITCLVTLNQSYIICNISKHLLPLYTPKWGKYGAKRG